MSIRIVTDSTADLPTAIVEQYGITVAPAYINIGEASYVDGVDLTRQTFYENLASYDPPPTTAAASSGQFSEIYTRLASEGASAIISIHLATELSGFSTRRVWVQNRPNLRPFTSSTPGRSAWVWGYKPSLQQQQPLPEPS